jgi:hypothetical protein
MVTVLYRHENKEYLMGILRKSKCLIGFGSQIGIKNGKPIARLVDRNSLGIKNGEQIARLVDRNSLGIVKDYVKY